METSLNHKSIQADQDHDCLNFIHYSNKDFWCTYATIFFNVIYATNLRSLQPGQENPKPTESFVEKPHDVRRVHTQNLFPALLPIKEINNQKSKQKDLFILISFTIFFNMKKQNSTYRICSSDLPCFRDENYRPIDHVYYLWCK